MTRTDRERALSAIYSANVRAELGRKRWKMTDLADETGMSIEAIRRRMRVGKGAAIWTASELQAVARALEVPMETLTAGAERAES